MGYTAPELRRIAELIDEETRKGGRLRLRERRDAEIDRGVRVVRDPRDINLARRAAMTAHETNGNGSSALIEREPLGPVHGFPCRTEGCENRANARYDRGPYYHLCYETCIPARRDELSQKQIKRRASMSDRPDRRPLPAPPAPEPARAPAPELAREDSPAERTFIDLAADFQRAHRFLNDADQAYEAAAEALLQHPLGQELLDLADLLVPGPVAPS